MIAALGQVFTPKALADLVLSLVGADAQRVMDPACGDGVFLARAAARGLCAVGVEIHPPTAKLAARHGRVECGDFLALPPPERPFDAVVGNPPYVRQETLGAAKARIAARIAADWATPVAWSGRADLALAFVARSLRFVRPGGRVALVVSAAVLEAAYGRLLDAFLDGRGRVAAVIASPRERWFRDAAVNAVILVLERDASPRPTLCARLRIPVAEAAARVRSLDDLVAVAEVRSAPQGQPLAPYLRAPDTWLEAASSPSLVPLDELAVVRRGVTSGANDFFYLARRRAADLGIEPEAVRSVLRSPRSAPRIAVRAAALPTLAFVVDAPFQELGEGARRYVEAHAAVAERPTLRARQRWWALPAEPARLFLTKAYHSRFVQPLADAPVLCDQRFYSVRPRKGVSLPLLAAVLNGTLTALALEALGRASLGEGALEVSVADAARLPVVDPRRLDPSRVLPVFKTLARRPTGEASAEAAAPDRRALDESLAADPTLAALVPELGAVLARAVDDRLARTRVTPSASERIQPP